MALALNFCETQSDDRVTLNVEELTGLYNAISNSGGYGAPNPAIADATAATIFFQVRNEDGTFTDYNTVAVYPTLPSTNGAVAEITAEDAGLGAEADSVFPDGIYQLTYTVSGVSGGNPFSATKTKLIYLIGGIQCCWLEKALGISACSCGCETLETQFLEIDTTLRLLEAARRKGNVKEAQDYITLLTNLCGDCSSGCSCS